MCKERSHAARWRRCFQNFGIEFIHQIDQLTQRAEALIKRLSSRDSAQSRQLCPLVDAETFTYHLFRTDQIGFEHQIIMDQCGGSFALPLQPEILNAQSQLRVSGTLEDLIVEIVFA